MLQNQDVASSSACRPRPYATHLKWLGIVLLPHPSVRHPKGHDGPCEIRLSVFVRSIIGWKSLGLEHKADSLPNVRVAVQILITSRSHRILRIP